MHLLQERWAKIKSRKCFDSIDRRDEPFEVYLGDRCRDRLLLYSDDRHYDHRKLVLATVGMNEWNPRLHLCHVGRKGGETRVRSLIYNQKNACKMLGKRSQRPKRSLRIVLT